jgi:hypothetical protein
MTLEDICHPEKMALLVYHISDRLRAIVGFGSGVRQYGRF